jgi:hypothetical protein
MKESSTPQQVSQCSTGDINIIKQSGWPNKTTPSEEEAGQSTKTCFYMANNRVGERPR